MRLTHRGVIVAAILLYAATFAAIVLAIFVKESAGALAMVAVVSAGVLLFMAGTDSWKHSSQIIRDTEAEFKSFTGQH